METFFAVAAPGLEPFTAQELRGLGLLPLDSSASDASAAPPAAGGVAFSGELTDLYRANLHLRTATRVLLRMGEFYVAAYSELRRKLRRLDWPRFLVPGQRVNIRVTCHKSKLSHSGDVADHVADAIAHRIGGPIERYSADEESNDSACLVVVRLLRDQCSVSIDTSGEPLHRRGYRQAVAKAPLRETVAAALLMATVWDARSPLLDPFCGSGVIPIEAALMALGVAPGRNRRFAFMNWPGFDAGRWDEVLAHTLAPAESKGTALVILGSDRDAGAIRMAQENAQRAGVAERILWSCHTVSAINPPPGPGWVVTNPPYGIRVSAGADLRNLYAQFGNVLRARCGGWQAGILCSDRNLLAQTRLSLETEVGFVTGGVRVWLGRGRV